MVTPPDDAPRPVQLDDVRGWFPSLDQVIFDRLLSRQEERGEQGDLLELGVYMGKSAIFLGRHLQDGERFTVCDLFESDAPDDANGSESAQSYPTLTRASFEANYLSFHDGLPRVLQGPSSVVPDRVEPGSCRFVHVDASHLFEHVRGDIGAARDALVPGGIVVIDDFRSEHTPGVAAAAWEAVLDRGLKLIALSTQKMYGTWGDPRPLQEDIIAMALKAGPACGLSRQQVAGQRLVRLRSKGLPAPEFPPSRHHVPEPEPASEPEREHRTEAPAPPRRSARSRARRVAVDVLPPVITCAMRRSRAQKRAAAR